jgi:hypothetical protein
MRKTDHQPTIPQDGKSLPSFLMHGIQVSDLVPLACSRLKRGNSRKYGTTVIPNLLRGMLDVLACLRQERRYV